MRKKSFHLTNERHDYQLEQASGGLMTLCKAVLCLIVIVWLCRDVTQPETMFHPAVYHPYNHNGSTLNLILDWF